MSAPSRSVATTSPVRAPVRSVGSGSALPMSFDVRTAFDFALSLAVEVGEQDELPVEDKTWLLEGRAAIPAPTGGLVIDDELCIFGAGLLVDHPEVLDAAGYVSLLRNTSGRVFADIVLADTLRDPEHHDDVVAALAGDEAAATRVIATWPEHKHGWLGKLLGDPDALIAFVADRMAAWLPRYQERESRFRTIIERDVALRAGERATLGPVELVERTTNGIRWLSEPGVRRVVLAPSYLVRPYNFTFTGGDWRIFVYPVADAAMEPHDPYAPPQGVLRLHRALGDDTRLRILRLLKDRDWYLTEIAERLELSKPTIKHHLVQLRAAGLVTLTEEGGLSYYSLRRERLDDASSELKRYLV
ncbi:MAG TPA: metalloregulator ArsR/SmtB family transcription factor [Candidatus Limnocylindrales bacterium]|nr:metalloregulator ArsR/SmtB family transcription factor [Candidatus Limnocylindrales bacterium]